MKVSLILTLTLKGFILLSSGLFPGTDASVWSDPELVCTLLWSLAQVLRWQCEMDENGGGCEHLHKAGKICVCPDKGSVSPEYIPAARK